MFQQGVFMQRTVINPRTVFNSLQYGFSQAVVVPSGRRVVLSGQVGVDAEENTVGTDVSTQITVALNNIEAILAEIGADLSHVVILRIYIVDAAKNDQQRITEALLKRFPVNPPATSWVIIRGLSEPEWLVEVEAEAVLPDEN
ncbi:RidA family protein [Myxacorys almedinensis]|nr:Rid family hydrolase [Myxacorys almedinensis]